MFDVSFSELLLCFVVALVVLGPERLPGVARAVGRWTGRAKAYMRDLTAELERETHISEMKKQVEEAHRILREQSLDVQRNVHSNLTAFEAEARAPILSAPEPPPSMPNAAPATATELMMPSAEVAARSTEHGG